MKLRILISDVFTIAGQGSVLAGTVAEGSAHVGQRVSVNSPDTATELRIDGLEIDREIVSTAREGDEVALLFHDLAAQALGGGIRQSETGDYEVVDLVVTSARRPWWRFWE